MLCIIAMLEKIKKDALVLEELLKGRIIIKRTPGETTTVPHN
jgi:hypothetical protein